jgi:Spy/CpxP family protein refolding chaperone
MERALGPDGSRVRWWNNPAIVEKMKLTDEQRKTMDGILLEHREKLIDLRGNVEKEEQELEPLIKADQPNEGKILAQIDKLAAARAELEKANARFLLALRAKLTPEQWKQLEEVRALGPHLHRWSDHKPGDSFPSAGDPKGQPAPEGASGQGDVR